MYQALVNKGKTFSNWKNGNHTSQVFSSSFVKPGQGKK